MHQGYAWGWDRMSRAIRIESVEVRGMQLSFGGVVVYVRNKRVARAMVRDGRPVWSCRPRPGGFAVLSLVDGASSDLTDRFMIDSTATDERVPGMSLGFVTQEMSRLYMQRLEAWVRGCQA